MPYDITPYRELKQLIPNHCLVINNQTAIRFVNFKNKQKSISVEEVTAAVLPMIEKLLAYYRRRYKIYCPITAGKLRLPIFAVNYTIIATAQKRNLSYGKMK